MLKYFVPLLAAGSLAFASATSPSIGLVKSTGDFRIDGSAVHGNATVVEGTLVETTAARSVIQLADAQITLAPDSRARIYRDHTVLEKGSGSVKDGARHVIEADTLRIAPSARDSVVQIEITDPSHVSVAVRGGSAEVRNSSGILTASLLPGMALAFDSHAAPATAVTMTGVIVARNGAYFLTDETTHVRVRLEGNDVSKYVGKEVVITGSSIFEAKPIAGASQLVRALTIKQVGEKRKAGAATATGSGAAAGFSGGISGTALVAIVGGVGVAATVGGLAAAGTFNSGPSISRQ
jgi:hypothetical protein